MYLKNNICKLKPLFNIDYSKKKNLLSGSLFRISGGGYKDLSYYVYLFEKSLFIYKKYLPDFSFRLFIDNSIYKDNNLMSKLNKLKNVELVLFECPDFIKDLDYHRGIFGMVVRFFPLFNFENNDANIVIISDLDFRNRDTVNLLSLKNTLKSFEELKIRDEIYFYYIGYTASMGNFWFKDFKLLKNNKIAPYFGSMNIICLKRFDKKSIEDYIINYKQFKEKILDGYSYFSDRKVKKSNDEFIFYGWDEYFLNSTFLDDNMKYPYATKYFINLGEIFYHIDRRSKDDKKMKEYLINFLHYIADKKEIINTEEYINEVSKIFSDENLNLEKKLNDEEVNLCFKMYEYYIKNYKDELMLKYFYKDHINIVLSDYYLGKILFEEVKVYNSKVDSINFRYLTLPSEKVEELRKLKENFNIPKVLI